VKLIWWYLHNVGLRLTLSTHLAVIYQSQGWKVTNHPNKVNGQANVFGICSEVTLTGDPPQRIYELEMLSHYA
jgi:hypothetical protein